MAKYLTPAEMAERYAGKITVGTLANWRSQGVGPKFSKIGGRILYPLAAVEEWEAGRTVTSTADYARQRYAGAE